MSELSNAIARVSRWARGAVPAGVRRRAFRAWTAQRQRRAERRRPLCPSVSTWATARGIESREILPEQRTTRRPPRTVEPTIHEAYTSNLHHHFEAVSLTPVPDATLLGPNGLVVLPDGQVALQSVNGRGALMRDRAYLSPHTPPARHMAGTYCSTITTWSGHNYYHWVHDSLQRLSVVLPNVPSDTRFVVPSWMSAVQRESLETFGIPADRIVEYSAEEPLHLELLLFAPPIGWTSHSRRDTVVALRTRILDALGIRSANEGRRLYVTRRSAAQRRTVNEDEVEAFLHRRGFETVVAEDLSFRQQVERFAGAEIVVSPHGAGLTNIFFAPPAAAVVEMTEPSMLYATNNYWTLADVLDLDYWYFIAESVPRPGHQHDSRIPLDKLDATLTAIEQASRG